MSEQSPKTDSTAAPTTELKRTPLYERHVAAGAKMVDFGGFEMPVRYAGEKLEHMAVREKVGVFDVSHMGEVFLEGEGALEAADRLFSNDLQNVADGQAVYTGMLNERGGFVDDVIIYRYSSTKLLVCVNASNRDKDFAWIDAVVTRDFAGRVTARDEGDAWGQIAVQGPKAVEVVAKVCGERAREVAPYRFTTGAIASTEGIIARTGYTGEDGFELYVPADQTGAVWDAVLEAGAPFGIERCGLACRDTLRLEAGLALYGNDIDEEHTPLEASLGWIVKLTTKAGEERSFIGADALRKQKAEGVKRRLRGVEMVERGIPRQGYRVVTEAGDPIGVVTSGTHAPFLNRPIAMAYIDDAHAAEGAEVFIEVRNKPTRARVVKLPFYRRPKSA